jgi:low temperature requirement protein LtrA
MTAAAAPAREEDGPGVTTLELFFDLVFVFTMISWSS